MDPSRNTYPSEKGEMNWSNQSPKPHPAYDPSTWGAPPQDRAVEGTLVLVDAETGNQVGTLGEHINVADVVPGSDGLCPTPLAGGSPTYLLISVFL